MLHVGQVTYVSHVLHMENFAILSQNMYHWLSEGSKGRQREPLRFSSHSHHTRTHHASSPISSSNTEAPDVLPYTLGLYQSSCSESNSSMAQERATRSSQHYSQRRHRHHQCRTLSSQMKRHHKHPHPQVAPRV